MDVVIEHNLSCPPQIPRAYYTVATSLVRAESERILAAIGLLGGTFDPVHIGHLIMAESARDALALERIEFIPTHIPPHKADELITPEYDRVAMLRAAIDGVREFSVNEIELARPGRSYTVDTLARLTADRPDDTFWFIVGSDSLRDLVNWREPARIIDLARIAVVPRPGVDVDTEALFTRLPNLRDRLCYVPAPFVDISSSRLRDMVRAGHSLRFQTPDAVIQYIHGHGLYRDRP
jgi:nicotinate-nucleotide adenylyltransferase